MIYLISDTGAVTSTTEMGARAAESIGYRRCTQEEWRRQRQWQQRAEAGHYQCDRREELAAKQRLADSFMGCPYYTKPLRHIGNHPHEITIDTRRLEGRWR